MRPHSRKTGCRAALRLRKTRKRGRKAQPSRTKDRDQTPRSNVRTKTTGSSRCPHVPSNGSARSGAVDLFIAGVRRTMDMGARFAVHCWSDIYGRSPHDFDEHDPVNELYLNYYMDMGMSHDKAHEFYAMTNSVPHSSALWFGPEEMQKWIDTPSEFDPAEDNRRRRLLDNERREPVQPSTRCPASANDILNGNSGSGMSAE